MSTIKYKVEIFSQWHCGSGLSAGADLDDLVIKDRNDLPYIPGKTIKGLIREAVEDYLVFSTKGKVSEIDQEAFVKTFGNAVEESTEEKKKNNMGEAFFSNVCLPEKDAEDIIKGKYQPYLYNKVASTAIGDDGIAKDHSLRTVETTIPCTLYGCITDVPESFAKTVAESFGLIKRLGQKRNRGLGRCQISIIEEGGNV